MSWIVVRSRQLLACATKIQALASARGECRPSQNGEVSGYQRLPRPIEIHRIWETRVAYRICTPKTHAIPLTRLTGSLYQPVDVESARYCLPTACRLSLVDIRCLRIRKLGDSSKTSSSTIAPHLPPSDVSSPVQSNFLRSGNAMCQSPLRASETECIRPASAAMLLLTLPLLPRAVAGILVNITDTE